MSISKQCSVFILINWKFQGSGKRKPKEKKSNKYKIYYISLNEKPTMVQYTIILCTNKRARWKGISPIIAFRCHQPKNGSRSQLCKCKANAKCKAKQNNVNWQNVIS